jgi:hypothetical protein
VGVSTRPAPGGGRPPAPPPPPPPCTNPPGASPGVAPSLRHGAPRAGGGVPGLAQGHGPFHPLCGPRRRGGRAVDVDAAARHRGARHAGGGVNAHAHPHSQPRCPAVFFSGPCGWWVSPRCEDACPAPPPHPTLRAHTRARWQYTRARWHFNGSAPARGTATLTRPVRFLLATRPRCFRPKESIFVASLFQGGACSKWVMWEKGAENRARRCATVGRRRRLRGGGVHDP